MKTANGVTTFSQRAIYDQRYAAGVYDNRSCVRVLTAEKVALEQAVTRTVAANVESSTISILDFGYGTGRVTNEFISSFPQSFSEPHRNLRVVGYDVSSTGLRRASEDLQKNQDFMVSRDYEWDSQAIDGYVAQILTKQVDDVELKVVLVHGSEADPPEKVRDLLITANGGTGYLTTTSWYSGLGHIVGESARSEFFAQLSDLTQPAGELVVALAATGDLVELQNEWYERLRNGLEYGYPIEVPGDVLYETELGQLNFWHVFGTDLHKIMHAMQAGGRRCWIEAIRFPGDEFATSEAEARNYAEVKKFNAEVREPWWTAEDFRKCHTVAVFSSGSVHTGTDALRHFPPGR